MSASIRAIVAGLFTATLFVCTIQAEETANTAAAVDSATKVDAPKADVAAKPQVPPSPEFQAQIAEWKKLLERMRELQVRYKVTKPADRPALSAEYDKLIAEGQKLTPLVVKAALDSYQANPNQNDEVSRFLLSQAVADLKADRYKQSFEIAKVLSDNEFANLATNACAGVAAFALNDYDAAEKYLSVAKEKKALGQGDDLYLTELANYRELWKKEQELRAAEAKAKDLPRVLLKTTAGDIELELFENEAPNSVANFVSLVEKGFYNGLNFHRVIHGFMAQGGDPKGDGSGGPGYTIACECGQPNHRNHFSGTLSMAHAGKDTGGSQFFITFRPTPNLNGKHTAFGRVVKGMDSLIKIKEQPTRGVEPDKILEAKVLRKREHEYKPKTSADK